MKNIFTFIIAVFSWTSVFGQGILLEPNGDINMDGESPELSFRNNDGSMIRGSLKLLPSGMYVENKELTPMYFQTNDENRMMINQFGDVGIGTINPLEKLHINGNIRLSDSEGRNSIQFYEGSSQKAFLSYNGTDMTLKNQESGDSDMIFSTTDDMIFTTNDLTRLYLSQGGNVGIGTTNPLSKLHINGDIRLSDGTGSINFFEGTTQKAYLSFNGNHMTLRNLASSTSDIFVASRDVIAFATDDDQQTRLLINKEGNIGIGVNSPTDRLEVLGSLRLRHTNGSSFAINTGSNGNLRFLGDGGETAMSIEDETGKVGINVNPAQAMLHIKEKYPGEDAMIIENDTNDNYWGFRVLSFPSHLTFRYNDNFRSSIDQVDGSYNNISDKRLKTNIAPMKDGILEKLLLLEPATYHFKDDKVRAVRSYGYIAQDAQKIFPEVVVNSGTAEGYLMINYSKVGVLAVKAIQELNEKIETKQQENVQLKKEVAQQINENKAQKQQLEDLTKRMLALETNLQSCCFQHHDNSQPNQENDPNTFDTERPQLQQNFPNPFSQQTEIQYYLPHAVQSAQIHISDLNGKALKTYQLADKGIGKITLNAGQLAASTYHYSLVIDGQLVDTKRLILTK